MVSGLLVAASFAQDPSIDEVFVRLSGPKTVHASFTQTQHRAVLSRPLESTGSMVFVRPDKLRWQVDTPTKVIFMLSGASLSTTMPDLGVSERITLAERPQYMGLVEGLTVWLHADANRVETDYDAAWRDGLLVLRPTRDELARWVQSFSLTLSADRSFVSQVELTEPDGDRVVFAFSEVRLDDPVDDGLFRMP